MAATSDRYEELARQRAEAIAPIYKDWLRVLFAQLVEDELEKRSTANEHR